MSEKIKNIITNQPEEKQRIENWQSQKLDEQEHIKYEPNSKNAKSHLEAIMADVNEPEGKVKSNLRTDKIAHDILNADSELMHILEGLSLSSEDDAKKIKNHREELKRQRENKAVESDDKDRS